MIELKIKEANGQYIDSREVAEMVEKEHKNLLADIRRYIKQLGEMKIQPTDEIAEMKIQPREFFIEDTYNDTNNQSRPCYMISKKGCEFIAHKLTGTKGTVFTAKYINKFHEMENILSNNSSISTEQFNRLENIVEKLANSVAEITETVCILTKNQTMYSKSIPSKKETDEEEEKEFIKKIMRYVDIMAGYYGKDKMKILKYVYEALEETSGKPMDYYKALYCESAGIDECSTLKTISKFRELREMAIGMSEKLLKGNNIFFVEGKN